MKNSKPQVVAIYPFEKKGSFQDPDQKRVLDPGLFVRRRLPGPSIFIRAKANRERSFFLLLPPDFEKGLISGVC